MAAVLAGAWLSPCAGLAGRRVGRRRRGLGVRGASASASASAPPAVDARAPAAPGTTLTRYMVDQAGSKPELQDMEALLAAVQMACKTLAVLVQRAGLDGTTGLGGEVNVQGEEQKKLDVISNEILKEALQYTGGKMGMVASEEEDSPMLVDEAYDSRYVAVFDPLDGSSNIDASIAVGTIFGIFEQTGTCILDEKNLAGDATLDASATSCLLNALQPGRSLVAAGYCMYSSSTILVLTLGDGVLGFTLDPALNEFVLSHPSIRIPDSGKIYSLNEANSPRWDPWLVDHLAGLKQRGYSARYIGSMVGDVHRTLLYGGFYAYPADTNNPQGKIRLLYEAAPISFLVEQAGGRCSTGTEPIIGIVPTKVHQRVPIFLGSKEDIAEIEAACAAASGAAAPPEPTELEAEKAEAEAEGSKS